MSDSSPKTPENLSANPVASLPQLDPVAAMFALGSAFRWPIIQMPMAAK